MNQLENLNTLVLSHNALKGSIPLDFNNYLSNLKRLFLHSNKLSGEAPRSLIKMDTYITDCGYPSETLDPVKCTTCTVCCNSDDLCYDQHGFSIKPIHIEIGLTLSIFGTMIVIYLLKDKIVQNKYLVRVFENKVGFWRASELIGEKSVYHFFLTLNWKGKFHNKFIM